MSAARPPQDTGASRDAGPANASSTGAMPDPLAAIDGGRRARFSAVAAHLIPDAHGMPSAGDVIDDVRLRFVLRARPDLLDDLLAALRPELGEDPPARLDALAREEPDLHSTLVSVVVFGYYTDGDVRERLGYPGQEAKTLYSWKVPDFIEEGLTDKVIARGPVWRDPATGHRAVIR